MNQCEISLKKNLERQVVNYALEANISDGVRKIIISSHFVFWHL